MTSRRLREGALRTLGAMAPAWGSSATKTVFPVVVFLAAVAGWSAAGWWVPARALAAEAGVVQSANVASTRDTRLDAHVTRLDEYTALNLGGRTLKLGLLSFDYGITDRINIGSDPTPWLLRTVTPVFVPNLHLKVVLYRGDAWWLTVQGGAYYALIGEADTRARLLIVPVSFFASRRMGEPVWLHGEVAYVSVSGTGAGDLDKATVGGAAANRALQAGAMLEVRVRRNIALTLRGRLQVYTGDLALSGSRQSDDAFTTIDVDARLTPRHGYPYMIVPGAAFLWRHVRLAAGIGYGHYFVPGMDVPLTRRGIVPDGSFSVVF